MQIRGQSAWSHFCIEKLLLDSHQASARCDPDGQDAGVEQDGREVQPRGRSSKACTILHRWDFTMETRRCVVVVQDLADGSLRVHCKGAPETITSLVRPASLPQDHAQVLARYTSSGLRVIALASGRLQRSAPCSVLQTHRRKGAWCPNMHKASQAFESS